MKKTKKLAGMLIAVVTALSCLTIPASAWSATKSENYNGYYLTTNMGANQYSDTVGGNKTRHYISGQVLGAYGVAAVMSANWNSYDMLYGRWSGDNSETSSPGATTSITCDIWIDNTDQVNAGIGTRVESRVTVDVAYPFVGYRAQYATMYCN